MELDDIAKLPLRDIAADRCALFVWVTGPLLDRQIEVIKTWGFEYKTIAFSWVKLNPSGDGVFFGVGFYTKSNVELCLLATRGQPIKPATDEVSQVIVAPRGEHSTKPDEAKRRIERLYPDARRIELFARRRDEHWHAWGNEVESDVILQDGRFVTINAENGRWRPDRLAIKETGQGSLFDAK
jgi:N6-adenosine-specific RNA methylase IME4